MLAAENDQGFQYKLPYGAKHLIFRYFLEVLVHHIYLSTQLESSGLILVEFN